MNQVIVRKVELSVEDVCDAIDEAIKKGFGWIPDNVEFIIGQKPGGDTTHMEPIVTKVIASSHESVTKKIENVNYRGEETVHSKEVKRLMTCSV